MSALPNYYIPDFEVRLNSTPMPPELRAGVTSVRFEEALEGADRVELQVVDPDLTLLDNPLLAPDVRLDLSLGYRPSTLLDVFTGDITGVQCALSESGPSVTVSAHDFMHRLTEGTKQRGFPWYLTDSVIATIVAAENRLISEPDAAASVASAFNLIDQVPRYQHKQSDYDFLRQIASEYGFDMWVTGDTLNFKLLNSRLPPSDLSLRWGQSLIDFSPRLTSIGQVATIHIRVYVEAVKTLILVSIGWDGDRITVNVSPATFSAATSTRAGLQLPDVPTDNPTDAIKWALGEMRRRVNSRVSAHGTAVGDPRYRVGEVVSFSNVGARFSGDNYRFTSVSHALSGAGYQTSFEVRQELI